MSDGFAVSAADVVRRAGTVGEAAGVLGDAATRFHGEAGTAASAFGNVPTSSALAGACLDAQGAAGAAGERVVETLEGDVDRLYQVAFAYQEAEQAAVTGFHRLLGGW